MTELATTNIFLPALSMEQAIERRNILVEMARVIMVSGTDYGVIPGTQKPTLMKPGAEKLCSRFGLVPTFELVDSIKDWSGTTFGAPLFYFEYRCRLIRDGQIVGEGIGSCNSWEKKYRYRSAERVCPSCGAMAIKKSKYPPRNNKNAPPGWYCYDKAGGCGTEFAANDPAIINQKLGQVENPDIFDMVNTISKMAQKRSLVAATLVATNASEFFTQDVEDMHVIDVTPVEQKQTQQHQQQQRKAPTRDGIIKRLNAIAVEAHEAGVSLLALDVLNDQDALESASNDDLIALGVSARHELDTRKAATLEAEYDAIEAGATHG